MVERLLYAYGFFGLLSGLTLVIMLQIEMITFSGQNTGIILYLIPLVLMALSVISIYIARKISQTN